MPYFAQEPLSYLTLPTIKNAYKAFSIKINFRPDNVDGEEVQPQISLTVKWSSSLFDTCFLCWLLMLSVLCCVLCLSYFSSCIISLRLLSLPSLPHLSLSHLRGGKVSYCTPVSLSAWEPQELKSEWWHFCFFGSIRLSHDASSSELMIIQRLWKRCEMVHGLCFHTGFFGHDRKSTLVSVNNTVVAWLKIYFWLHSILQCHKFYGKQVVIGNVFDIYFSAVFVN